MKLWHEAPSGNFKLKPTKDMLIGFGISKLFSSVPTRSTIAVELRPRELYQYETSYVIAYLNNVFDKLGATLDHQSLSRTLSHLAKADRSVSLEINVIDANYVDDYSPEYLIAETVFKFLSVTDNPDSPRNKKATELAVKIKNLITADVYQTVETDYHRKRGNT